MIQEMQVLAGRMARGKDVRLVGRETDMTFSIEGRKPIIDWGEKNLPGGEVFTSPVEDSVNGNVYFDRPFIFQGTRSAGYDLRTRAGTSWNVGRTSGPSSWNRCSTPT
jgi:aminopeptidase